MRISDWSSDVCSSDLRREQLGGTWDLFRYPGIRSDSDMHTLGFIFEPWKHEKSIADGPAILEYLNRIVDERHIREPIRLDSTVVGPDWDSAAARWTVTMGDSQAPRYTRTARWLYLRLGREACGGRVGATVWQWGVEIS